MFWLELEMFYPILLILLFSLIVDWLSMTPVLLTKRKIRRDRRVERLEFSEKIIIAPIFEEIIFRGPIYWFFNELSTMCWALIIISAMIFGIWHFKFRKEFPLSRISFGISTCLIGILLGWLTIITGSLAPAIIVHAAINLHWEIMLPAIIKRKAGFFILLILSPL